MSKPEYQYSFEQLTESYQRTGVDFMTGNVHVSLEFRVGDFIKNVFGFIKERLNVSEMKFVPTNLPIRPFESVTRDINYVSLSPVEIFMPAGLRTDLKNGVIDYTHVLKDAQKEVVLPLNQGLLIPASRYFAAVATNLSLLNGSRSTLDKHGLSFPDVTKHKTNIGNCFSGLAARDRMTYGHAFRRNNDLIAVVKEINELNAAQATTNERDILQNVNAIDKAAEKIAHHFSEENGVTISADQLKELADTMLLLAQNVEFYSAFSYNLMALSNAMKDNSSRFQKMFG